VDGEVADFEDLVLVAGTTQDQPMSFMRMKVTRADQKMTQTAARPAPTVVRRTRCTSGRDTEGHAGPFAVRYVAWLVAMTCPEAVR